MRILFPGYYQHIKPYLSLLQIHRVRLLLLLMIVVFVALTNTWLMWLLGRPINLLSAAKYDEFYQLLGVIGLVIFFKFAAHFSYQSVNQDLGLRLIIQIRASMLRHLLQVSFPVAGRWQKGDLLARLSNDIDQFKPLLLDIPLDLLANCLVLLIYSSALIWIDWRLSLVVLAISPLFYLHQKLLAPQIAKVSDRYFKANGNLLGYEEQCVANLQGISSMDAQQMILHKHVEVMNSTRLWGLRQRLLNAFYNASFYWIGFVGVMVVLIFGIGAVETSRLNVGDLVSFLLFLGYLTLPVQGLAQIPLTAKAAMAAFNRVQQVFDSRALINESASSNSALRIKRGAIELKRISFRYNNGPRIFDSVSLSISPGETVALVGASGSGKSTLARLLLRFYDVEAGAIAVDGVDIREYPLTSLRQGFAVVWQDPFLFSGSVADNLRLANQDADEAAIVAACRSALCWEFVQSLPQGMHTLIGSGGVDLSTGQKQRLSIAQAFLRDAPILVMDEASSALDSQSEQAITQSLEALRNNRTTILIAHRFSSLKLAKRIIFLNGDGSVSTGEHEEMYRSHANYRDAIMWQFNANSA